MSSTDSDASSHAEAAKNKKADKGWLAPTVQDTPQKTGAADCLLVTWADCQLGVSGPSKSFTCKVKDIYVFHIGKSKVVMRSLQDMIFVRFLTV